MTYAQVWGVVKTRWSNPRLNDPVIHTNEESAMQAMGDSLAFINMGNRRIDVNGPLLKKKAGMKYLFSVENHEVGHYAYAPYDLRTHLRLIGEAVKVVNSGKAAHLMENLFTDILINTENYRKGDRKVVPLYQHLSNGNDSKSWNVYMNTYENMMQLQHGTLSDKVDDEMRCDAVKLSKIMEDSTHRSKRWPGSIKEFSEIMKKYMEEDEKDGKSADPGLVDKHSAKDFVPFKPTGILTPGQKHHVEKETKGLAKQLGQKAYSKAMSASGLATPSQASEMFYRDLASQYAVIMPSAQSARSDAFPISPEKWSPEMPAETLDIPYSLGQSGVVIPGVTTKRWKYEQGETYSRSNNAPDLAIVLDSSGSMPDPTENTSLAVLSAMIAAHSALAAGSKVGVINFSSDHRVQGYTNNAKDVDRTIMTYLGGGTVIPSHDLVSLVKSNPGTQHLLLITDTGISNLESAVNDLESALVHARGGGTVFINCPSENTEKLSSIGYTVIPVHSFNDLVGLTLEKTKELYGQC